MGCHFPTYVRSDTSTHPAGGFKSVIASNSDRLTGRIGLSHWLAAGHRFRAELQQLFGIQDHRYEIGISLIYELSAGRDWPIFRRPNRSVSCGRPRAPAVRSHTVRHHVSKSDTVLATLRATLPASWPDSKSADLTCSLTGSPRRTFPPPTSSTCCSGTPGAPCRPRIRASRPLDARALRCLFQHRADLRCTSGFSHRRRPS